MQSYEAIRWALDRLNKEKEELNGEYLNDTYIPGVKLGKSYSNHIYRKVPKFSDPKNFAVIYLTSKRRGHCQKHANGIANSEDPYQTAI